MRQMKPALLSYLLAVLLVAKLSVGHAGIPGNMGMDHVGFVVPNAQEAVDFLITLFDCEFDWEVRRDPTPTAGERGWSKIFDIHTESYMPQVVMLKCGDHHLTQYIEVFEWYSPDQYKPPHNGWLKMTDIGWGYFSFTVKDVFAVVEHIKRANIPGVRIVQDPPMSFPLRGELCTSTFMVAPWGQWIELTQWSVSGPQGTVIKKLTDMVTIDETEGCKKNIYSPDSLHLGKRVEELETPALIVDLNAFEHNIELMYSRASAKGVTWIPAVKAHKSPGLSKRILAAGGQGVLLLKISEVEAFIKADKDINDIYLANEVIDPEKIGKLVRAARQLKRLRVNVDDEQNIRDIALRAHQANTVIEMMVEVDIGHHRCGVTPPEAVELAKVIDELERANGAVRFAGITGYEGHTPVLPPDEKTKETFACHAILAEAKRLIEEAGLAVKIVSGGGSSNYIDALNTGVLTELQAGGGALTDNLYYNKANLKDHGHQVGFFVLTQIMSVPKDQSRAMADAGHKALGWHPFGGLAQPFGRDDIEVYGLSAEHTKIRAKLPEGATEQERPPVALKRGDKILLVPGYGDSMGFMHQQIYAVRNGIVEDVWPIVAANQIQ